MGFMYKKGHGVPKDYKTAMKWFTLAAEQGVAKAQYNIGVMYDKGHGVPKDYKTAVKWYTLAVEQGHAKAQYNLGLMYAKGKGVPQNNVYAYMWGNLAASNGDEGGGKLRDLAAEIMTPSQIEKAQELSRECVAKNYKGC